MTIGAPLTNDEVYDAVSTQGIGNHSMIKVTDAGTDSETSFAVVTVDIERESEDGATTETITVRAEFEFWPLPKLGSFGDWQLGEWKETRRTTTTYED